VYTFVYYLIYNANSKWHYIKIVFAGQTGITWAQPARTSPRSPCSMSPSDDSPLLPPEFALRRFPTFPLVPDWPPRPDNRQDSSFLISLTVFILLTVTIPMGLIDFTFMLGSNAGADLHCSVSAFKETSVRSLALRSRRPMHHWRNTDNSGLSSMQRSKLTSA
jgi:hypothetical protein